MTDPSSDEIVPGDLFVDNQSIGEIRGQARFEFVHQTKTATKFELDMYKAIVSATITIPFNEGNFSILFGRQRTVARWYHNQRGKLIKKANGDSSIVYITTRSFGHLRRLR